MTGGDSLWPRRGQTQPTAPGLPGISPLEPASPVRHSGIMCNGKADESVLGICLRYTKSCRRVTIAALAPRTIVWQERQGWLQPASVEAEAALITSDLPEWPQGSSEVTNPCHRASRGLTAHGVRLCPVPTALRCNPISQCDHDVGDGRSLDSGFD